MPRETTTTCDACGQQLSDAGAMPTYAMALSPFSVPNSGGVVFGVAVLPPIRDSVYVCSIGCLWKWLSDAHPDAAKQFEKQQRHRAWLAEKDAEAKKLREQTQDR